MSKFVNILFLLSGVTSKCLGNEAFVLGVTSLRVRLNFLGKSAENVNERLPKLGEMPANFKRDRLDFKPFKIGKYLLLERLAAGGMAEVYRAKASGAGGFEKQLAVKRILPNYSQNEEFRRMFEYEARLSSMLTHANIVQIYDFVKASETYLLAMEYVDGKNLRQLINKARKLGIPLPIEFGVYVVSEVCKGLEYAHKKKDDLNGRPLNIIHRDMSPQNIMISYEGAVKIVDFGIAKAKDRVDETRSGVIKGKFGYMSPEQANGENVDHRTDIFSTGIILWELLTGKRLFAAENDMATLKLIQECVIPPPSRQNPKVTQELEKILIKGLTKDLRLRYQDAGLFHRSLQEYLNKFFPSFTQKEAADLVHKVFRDEIELEKKRFEQIHRQSIPFSQGVKSKSRDTSELDQIGDALEGDITKSEADAKSAITFAEGESSENASGGNLSGNSNAISFPNLLSNERNRDPGSAADSDSEPGSSTKVESVFSDPNEPKAGIENSVSGLSDFVIGNSVPGVESVTQKEVIEAENDSVTEKTKVTGEDTLFKEKEKMEVLKVAVAKVDFGRARGRVPGRVSKDSSPSNSIDLSSSSPIVLEREPTARASRNSTTPEGIEERQSFEEGANFSGIDRGYENDSISLSSMSESRPIRADGNFSGINRDGIDSYPEREDYLPNRRRFVRSFFSFLFLVGISFATYALYRFAFSSAMPELVRKIAEKSPEREKSASEQSEGNATVNSEVVTRRPVGDCTLKVDSDPPAAKIFIEGQERGITSAVLFAPCQQSFDVTLRLEGYESVSQNIVLTDKETRILKTLKKIPTGKLTLIANRNVSIYLEGNLVKEARQNEWVEFALRAGVKHKVRFVNPILGIDKTEEYFIEEGLTKSATLNF